MPLMTMTSDLSWYGTPAGFTAPTETRFSYNTEDLTVMAKPRGWTSFGMLNNKFVPIVSKDQFNINEYGTASRRAQLGNGSKFPIGPEGQIHEFDIKRTGWNITSKYGDTYSSKTLSGLAATYTANSPIDDMYNKYIVREEVYDPFGYAKTPFILRGIQREGSSDPQRWGLGGTTAGVISSLLDVPRGGPLASGDRIASDVARISKFLIRPAGLAFIAKQQLLRLMSPNTEDVLGTVYKLNPQKVYNPANTLLSVAGSGLGLRFRNYGLLPVGGLSRYEDIHKQRRNLSLLTGIDIETKQNRLNNLLDERTSSSGPLWLAISGATGPDSVGGIGFTNFTKYTSTTLRSQLDFHGGNIKLYGNANVLLGNLITPGGSITTPGGITINIPTIRGLGRLTTPGSPYMRNANQVSDDETENALRRGATFNKTQKVRWGYDETTNSWNRDNSELAWSVGIANIVTNQPPQETKPEDQTPAIAKYKTLDYPTIMRLASERANGTTRVTDFRTGNDWNTEKKPTLESKYGYNKYDPESRKQSQSDSINSIEIGGDYSNATSDLIKFRFAPIKATNLESATGNIIFRAYLSNLSDQFSPTWDGIQDQGRADTKVRYTSFERAIDVSFKVVVHSSDEQKIVWDKLAALSKITYPVYASGGFHGVYVKVTIGDLYVNQPMYITSLSYNWDTETPWEITDGKQLPFYTDVDMSLTWIGERRPSYTNSTVFSYK